MAETCPPGTRSDAAVIQALDQLWEVTPEDIKSDWMDIMVKRLFRELNKQLAVIENKKVDTQNGRPDSKEQAQNAKTLASLEATLERLSRLEKERDARRTKKKVLKHADARKEIERKVAGANAAGESRRVSAKPER